MNILRQQQISTPGTQVNEDRVHIGAGAAWVLDGATGLYAERLFPAAASDPAHFVAIVDRALQDRLPPGGAPLPALLGQVLTDVREHLRTEACLDGLDAAQCPSAAMALAAYDQDLLHLAVLADCRVLVQDDSGLFLDLSDERIAPLEAAAVADLHARLQAGATLAEGQAAIWPMLRDQRRLSNTPGGYWVLGLDPHAATEVKLISIRTTAERVRILLMTDGFSRLLDFGLLTPTELLKRAATEGLAPLLQELQAVEAADPGCLRHPRVKPADDATAAYLELGR